MPSYCALVGKDFLKQDARTAVSYLLTNQENPLLEFYVESHHLNVAVGKTLLMMGTTDELKKDLALVGSMVQTIGRRGHGDDRALCTVAARVNVRVKGEGRLPATQYCATILAMRVVRDSYTQFGALWTERLGSDGSRDRNLWFTLAEFYKYLDWAESLPCS